MHSDWRRPRDLQQGVLGVGVEKHGMVLLKMFVEVWKSMQMSSTQKTAAGTQFVWRWKMGAFKC